MFRELTLEELEMISGGQLVYREATGYAYYGGSWQSVNYGSGGGGGGGYNTEVPEPPPPPPEPSDIFRLAGHIDCEHYTNGFNVAVKDLAGVSPLFRDMLDTIHKAGYSFDLIKNGEGNVFNSTDNGARTIHWDPLSAISLVDNNRNATGGTQTSQIALVHEIAHAYLHVTNQAPSTKESVPYYDNALERKIILEYESKIIDQSNAVYDKYGMHSDKRTNHYGSYFNVESAESTTFSINRQGCY